MSIEHRLLESLDGVNNNLVSIANNTSGATQSYQGFVSSWKLKIDTTLMTQVQWVGFLAGNPFQFLFASVLNLNNPTHMDNLIIAFQSAFGQNVKCEVLVYDPTSAEIHLSNVPDYIWNFNANQFEPVKFPYLSDVVQGIKAFTRKTSVR